MYTISQFSPASFPHDVTGLEWRETHISQLILTGEWVYKIKKPVNFGFLDFSTLERRQRFCEEEVRLNQRSAPELYVAVVPVHRVGDKLNVLGDGELVDYAVKMRQFDPDALLLHKMPDAIRTEGFFQSLGYELARFHEAAKVCDAEADFGSAAAVQFPVQENFRQIMPRLVQACDLERTEQVAAWAAQEGARLSELFNRRKANGFIRECHGDLHLGNIALLGEAAVMFDCIEFNDRFRWIDVASDLAFLVMDLTFRGYPQQANDVLNSYLEYSGDYELLMALPFYMCYRAMVRAKVSVLRMEQAEGADQAALLEEFRAYVAFALRCVEQPVSRLLLTCGVSGSGKSTFARQLAAQLGAIHLRSDVVRKRLVGLKPLESSQDWDPNDPTALYTPSFSEQTFARLLSLAEQVLAVGLPVVVDATFLRSSARSPFQLLADRRAVPYNVIHLDAPIEVLTQRIEQRLQQARDASEADVNVMKQQLNQFEPFGEHELPHRVRFTEEVTAATVSAFIARFFSDA